MTTTCLHCGEPLPEDRVSWQKYCDRKCRWDAHYLREGDKIRAQTRARQHATYVPKGERTFTCQECGEDFTASRDDARFCSPTCSNRTWKRNNPEKRQAHRAREKAARQAARPIVLCDEEGCERTDIRPVRSGTKCDMHYQQAQLAARQRSCPRCGADLSERHPNAVYCSTTCRQANNRELNADLLRVRGRLHEAARRAAAKGAGVVDFTLEQWEGHLAALGNDCTYCGITAAEVATWPVDKRGRGNKLEMDHIVPLARGGIHALANLTPACPICNRKKRTRRLLAEWAPPRLGGLPSYDPTRPYGSKYLKYDPAQYRDTTGPLAAVLQEAARYPALLRAIRIAEEDLALAA